MVHSVGVNLAYIINFIVQAKDPETGEKVVPLVLQEDGKPFINTEVAAWDTLLDYFQAHLADEPGGPEIEASVVTGDRARSVESDVAFGPGDISWSPPLPARGESVTIEVTLRNFGDQPVKDCMVEFYYDSTPWDLTDDDDGLLTAEGFAPSFKGSLLPISTEKASLEPYPATTTVQVSWDIPSNLVPYDYPVIVRVTGVKGEYIHGNNQGPDQARKVPVRFL